MKKNFSPRFLVPIFVVILALQVANASWTFRNLQTLHLHQQLLDHTRSVLDRLEAVIALLTDAETSVRGYALAPTNGQMNLYNDAVREMPSELERLRFDLRDNPEQVDRVDRLRNLVEGRLSLLGTVAARVGQHPSVAELSDLVNQGKSVMDHVRSVAKEIGGNEREMLRQRAELTERSLRNAEFSIYAGNGIMALFTVATFALLFWQMRSQNKQQWLRQSTAELHVLVRQATGVQEYCEKALQFVTERLGASVSAFFVRQKGSLLLVHGKALPTDLLHSRVQMGEGLVGRAAVEQNRVLVDEPRQVQALEIQAGTDRLTPAQLLIQPLVFQGETVGVLEFAATRDFYRAELDLADALRETLAVGLQSVISREQLQELLEETQSQAEELTAQQEELRSYTQQLEAQTMALQTAQQELEAQQEELRQTNEELEQQARALEAQQTLVFDRNEQLVKNKVELEQKARELSQASQYKSQFLANMSHELRTPLNSLLILASLLADNKGGRLNSEEVEFAQTIYNSGNDLLLLINDILDLTKIESGNVQLELENVDVDQILGNLERTYRAAAETKGLEFKVQSQVPGLLMRTDRLRLEQILRNFLSNAIKFTEHGQIALEVKSEGASLVFEVSDTGVGIPTDKQDLIFEAFQQADGTTSRKYGGTGLGLTISRELASLLGGRIEVRSAAGQGSTFALLLPLNQSQPGAAPPPSAAPTSAPRREKSAEGLRPQAVTIPPGERYLLIVEDDEAFGATLQRLSQEAGFPAMVVGDGEQALAAVEARMPAGILLDVKLPTISGFAVLQKLKANPATRHIPVHMVSGVEHTFNALRLGAMGYLVKPATREKLMEAIGRVAEVAERDVKAVLIVEDDEVQRNSLCKLIQSESVTCETVGTGGEALERLSRESFQCVILDLNLPDMSGFELLQRLENEVAAVPPVVVYTGRELSRKETDELRRYSESIIIKGARSPERLMEEVSLFLHQLESELSPAHRDLLLSAQRGHSFQGRKVLLVDDDLRNTFALMSALEPEGLEIVVARNGIEALQALEEHPDTELVLMDIMMPEMDGLEAISRIRKNRVTANLPIIALTAKAMKEDQERCLQAGANDYLTKPFKLDHLFSLLRVWLPEGSGLRG